MTAPQTVTKFYEEFLMYTMVLMMAASSSGESPEFFRHGTGCTGTTVVVATSCTGCTGVLSCADCFNLH